MTRPAQSLTARMDNAALDPALVAAGRQVLRRVISEWEPAGPKEQALFRARQDLAGLGSHVVAVAHLPEGGFWVLENLWEGFPGPAQYMLVGFGAGGVVTVLAAFEDWPAGWNGVEA